MQRIAGVIPFPAIIVLVVVAMLCFLALWYARNVEPNKLTVRKVRLDGGKAIRSGTPLKIALLSDFHYPRWTSHEMVRSAIDLANQFEPDVVFILGDIIDKGRFDPYILPKDINSAFGDIRSWYGVFGVLGNHDHWFDAPAIRDALTAQTQIRLIDNAAVRLDTPGPPLYVVGVGDLETGNADYEQAVREVPPDAFILLLSHNPDVVEDIRDPRIIAQFSGHTHGGQVRLPFMGAVRVPSRFGNKYSMGLCRQGNHLLYVNVGVCSMRHIRFLCPPEVTWVELPPRN